MDLLGDGLGIGLVVFAGPSDSDREIFEGCVNELVGVWEGFQQHLAGDRQGAHGPFLSDSGALEEQMSEQVVGFPDPGLDQVEAIAGEAL